MKHRSTLIITFVTLSFSAALSQQLSAEQIVQNATRTYQQLTNIKYFIKKYEIDKGDTVRSIKGTVTLTKDASVQHPIFTGYKFKSEVEIFPNGNSVPIAVMASFDGKDLQTILEGKLTTYKNPDASTTMQKFGIELFLLIYNGFIKPDGLDFLLERKLELISDKVVNGVNSYGIKAVTSFPSRPGSSEMIESTTTWYFSKVDYMPVCVDLGNQISLLTVIDRNFKSKVTDYTLETQYTSKEVATNADVERENLIDIGKVAPTWVAKDANEKEIKLTDYRGKILILDFWGTWCPPCLRSMPSIQKLYDTYKSQIEVIGVAVNDKPKKAIDYMKNKGYSYQLIPQGNEIAKMYDVAVYPTFYILDQKGIVRYREKGLNENGFEDWSEVVQNLLEQ